MDIKSVRKGMKIRVSNNLERTEERFTTTSHMRAQRGKIHIIEHVNNHDNSVNFLCCVWDVHDVQPLVDPADKIKTKPETFDPSELDL